MPTRKQITRGIGFFVIVFLLSITPAFRQVDLFLFDIGREIWFEREPSKDQENLYCLDDLRYKYGLKETYDLVKRLKSLGVKVVVFNLEEEYAGKNLDYADSLARTDIVVFAVRSSTKYGSFRFGGVSQLVGMDLIVDDPRLPAKSTWGVLASSYDEDGVARRFIPYGCVMWQTTDTIPDVALVAAGKYFNYSSATKPRRVGRMIEYGDLRIPIGPDGSAYVLGRDWFRTREVNVLDSLRFSPRFFGEWTPEMLRGKIVYLGNGSTGPIQTLLGHRFVVPGSSSSRFIILALCALLPFLAGMRFEARKVLLGGSAIAFVYLVVSFVLFVWVGWYVEVIAPFLTLLCGGVVFAYFRRSDENKTLEAEKKRILESQKEQLEKDVAERTRELQTEKEETERLLYNILPVEIARELKEKGTITPRRYEEVTILFTDFRGFTNTVAAMPPKRLVEELNDIFRDIDDIIDACGLEKIKTIGDSYMIAAGLPKESENHARQCVKAAMEMVRFIIKRNETSAVKWQMRVGIHSGAAVAGVVGKKKFTYDVWGDTVNIASRMETSGEPGRINISAYTYDLIKDFYVCEYRGKIDAKGKGEIDMYFVVGEKGGG